MKWRFLHKPALEESTLPRLTINQTYFKCLTECSNKEHFDVFPQASEVTKAENTLLDNNIRIIHTDKHYISVSESCHQWPLPSMQSMKTQIKKEMAKDTQANVLQLSSFLFFFFFHNLSLFPQDATKQFND